MYDYLKNTDVMSVKTFHIFYNYIYITATDFNLIK